MANDPSQQSAHLDRLQDDWRANWITQLVHQAEARAADNIPPPPLADDNSGLPTSAVDANSAGKSEETSLCDLSLDFLPQNGLISQPVLVSITTATDVRISSIHCLQLFRMDVLP